MKTATVRELRTQFPRIRQLLEQEGEVVVTDHGTPVAVLKPFRRAATRSVASLDYYARLRARMPKPLTKDERHALDEADRDER